MNDYLADLFAESYGDAAVVDRARDGIRWATFGHLYADYYGDMQRWSFTLQLEFLLRRVEHHELIHTVKKSCVQDRTLYEDPEIFAKYLHDAHSRVKTFALDGQPLADIPLPGIGSASGSFSDSAARTRSFDRRASECPA